MPWQAVRTRKKAPGRIPELFVFFKQVCISRSFAKGVRVYCPCSQKKEGIPLNHRGTFMKYVAEALASRAGIPQAKAAALVEESGLGALAVGNLSFLSYKGPEYWAEKILESRQGRDGASAL